MTVSPSRRAACYVLAKKDAKRAEKIFKQMIKIEKDAVPRPPIDYVTNGLKAIIASQSGIDFTRHPHRQPEKVVPLALQPEPTPAQDDAIARETIKLKSLLQPGTQWHCSGETLCDNLAALRDGYLIFPVFVRQ